jgi:hypothetical protein
MNQAYAANFAVFHILNENGNICQYFVILIKFAFLNKKNVKMHNAHVNVDANMIK